MKNRIERKFKTTTRRHKWLKVPCAILYAIFLVFYYPLSLLFSNRRKIAGAALVCLTFACFSSFSFAEERKEDSEKNAVYLETDQGSIIVEELDEKLMAEELKDSGISGEDDELEVGAADLMEAMQNASSGNRSIEYNSQADDSARVFDEDKGYVKALYKDDWSLILINKEHPIPVDYEFELATIRGNIKSDIRVMPYVLEMINAAKNDGVTLYICSPFRSDEKQEVLFKKKQKYYMRQGYSEEEAYNLASQTIAIPGTSEHQVGLAFDFISNEYKYLDAGFADTAAGRWLKKHCAEYGFILRYDQGKEDITQIEFEPWHYRYVGRAAAKEIMESGLSLEEYVKEIGAVE